MSNTTIHDTADRELAITRTLNAPIDLVWEVWTKPEHIKNWWGPTGFTNTIHTMEVKPGGIWEFIMYGPDGNKTILHWRMHFETAEEFQQVVKVFKADEGLKQNVVKLENYLAALSRLMCRYRPCSRSSFRMVSSSFLNPGRSFLITFQTTGRSVPKYS